jgi:excisionase family DNA binding protein
VTITDASAPALLRVAEAAQLLNVSRAKAYELIAAGAIPSVRVGASVRVPRAALLEWIERNTVGAGAPA